MLSSCSAALVRSCSMYVCCKYGTLDLETQKVITWFSGSLMKG